MVVVIEMAVKITTVAVLALMEAVMAIVIVMVWK
jgi:hypothetical protein